MKIYRTIILVVLFLALAITPADAVTKKWDGDSCPADCSFSTGANWDGDTAPVASDDIRLNGTADSILMDLPDTYGFLNMTAGFSGHLNLTGNTVFSDVIIAGGILYGDVAGSKLNHSFGSLTINSGGTYNATSGTTTITSEAPSGKALDHDGTFIANNGTVNITTGSTTIADISGTGNLYNLVIDTGGTIVEHGTAPATIDNDLTIYSGGFEENGDTNRDLTVIGDVVTSGTLGRNSATFSSPMTFGSLTINSGGTYYATNGTTTITSETAGNRNWVNEGTFTHNNGVVNMTYVV